MSRKKYTLFSTVMNETLFISRYRTIKDVHGRHFWLKIILYHRYVLVWKVLNQPNSVCQFHDYKDNDKRNDSQITNNTRRYKKPSGSCTNDIQLKRNMRQMRMVSFSRCRHSKIYARLLSVNLLNHISYTWGLG